MNVSCPECQSVFRVDPARVPGPGIRARCSVCGGIIPITATRSWTDDFATPHDAASLTTSGRTAARPISGGSGATAEPRAGMASRPTPPVGVPRNPTPARVPPFGVAKRPTPAAPSPVPPVAPPTIARTAPQIPQAQPPQPRPVAARPEPAVTAPTNAAPTAQPPRVADVPIGAPIAKPVAPPPAAPTPRPSADAPAAPSVAAAPAPAARPADAAPAAAGKAPINPFLANDPNQKAKRLARALVSDMVAYHPQKRDEGMRAGTLKQLFREEIKKSYEEYVEQIGKEFAESTSHFQDALNDVLAGGKKVF